MKLIKKVVVTSRISDDFASLLDAYAVRFESTRGELIKEAIGRYLGDLKNRYGLPEGYKKDIHG